MASLCGARVRMNNFSSKTTRPIAACSLESGKVKSLGLNRLEKNESYVSFLESQYFIQFLERKLLKPISRKLLKPISMLNVNFNTL